MRERATLRFIADRMTWPAGETGRSSDAMLREAIGGDYAYLDDYPMDDADLNRCYLTLSRAPRYLQRRMRPIIFRFEERLRQEQLGTVGPRPPAPPTRLT